MRLVNGSMRKVATKKPSHKIPQEISEELKREMIGDKLYNKSYKKTEGTKLKETNKLPRIYTLSHIEEDHLHHELDSTLCQKPTSRGRKR